MGLFDEFVEEEIIAEEFGGGFGGYGHRRRHGYNGFGGGVDYNLSSGGLDVEIGGGFGIDTSNGDLTYEIAPGLDIDL